MRHKDWGVREKAAEALSNIGEPAVEPLTQALRDEFTWVREGAARALGKIGEPAVEPLIQALKDEHNGVRWRAALALGEIGDRRAIKPLYEIIMSDRDKDVRERAAEALDKLADKYGFTSMELALQEAAEGLGRFAEGKFKTVEQLIHALQNDSNPFVRMGAAIDLGLHGDPKAIEPLRYAIQHDPNPAVRKAAKEALEKIKSKNLK